MAYKFYSGPFNSSGTLNIENSITGNALAIDTGGITVTAGASSFQALTGTTVSASSKIQIGAVSIDSTGLLSGSNLVITASAISASSILVNTLSAPNLTLSGDLIVSGNTTLGNASSDVIIVSGILTGSAGVRLNAGLVVSGGAGIVLRDAADAAEVFNVGTNGNVSGSGSRQIGGALVVAGSSSLQAVTASALSSSGGLQVGGGLNVAGNAIVTGTLTVNGAVTFPNTVTIKDLFVTGTTTSVSSTNLNIADAKVVIASGSTTTASFDTLDPAGLYIGGSGGDGTDAFGRIALSHSAGTWTWEVAASGVIDPALKIGGGPNGTVAIGSTTVLSQTALFGGAVTGSSVGVGLKLKYSSITTTPFTPALSEYVLGVATTGSAMTISLPAPGAGDIGRVLLIKDVSNNASVNNITIAPNGTDTIDGVNASVKLESNGAAIHCIVTAANKWGLF